MRTVSGEISIECAAGAVSCAAPAGERLTRRWSFVTDAAGNERVTGINRQVDLAYSVASREQRSVLDGVTANAKVLSNLAPGPPYAEGRTVSALHDDVAQVVGAFLATAEQVPVTDTIEGGATGVAAGHRGDSDQGERAGHDRRPARVRDQPGSAPQPDGAPPGDRAHGDGVRGGDACELAFSPMIDDSVGWPCLRFANSKVSTEQLIPLSAKAAETIRAQQAHVRTLHPQGSPWLFPGIMDNANGAKPYAHGTLSGQLGRWQKVVGVHDEAGQPVRVHAHQFRHTVGTRLKPSGVALDATFSRSRERWGARTLGERLAA